MDYRLKDQAEGLPLLQARDPSIREMKLDDEVIFIILTNQATLLLCYSGFSTSAALLAAAFATAFRWFAIFACFYFCNAM